MENVLQNLGLLIAAAITMTAYFVGMAMMDRYVPNDRFKREMLERVRRENRRADTSSGPLFKGEEQKVSPILIAIFLRPGMRNIYKLASQADMEDSLLGILIGMGILVLLGTQLAANILPPEMRILSVPCGILIGFMLMRIWLSKQVKKQKLKFVDQFPEALEMMVRSVRSGYPMNSSLSMVAENMKPPISKEFKIMVEEIAYGRSFPETARRMAERVEEADVRFFTVVLTVQQETGGNLSEVLSNLASVIRKRKQLRQKIRAMTSEGRTTMWIMSGLPVVLSGVLAVIAPEHLKPLIDTDIGNNMLMFAIGLVVTAIMIVRKMIDIDI